VLEVQDLVVAFGGLLAVDKVSFRAGDNEVLSIIGPNGAGKTTVFNAVSGFVAPTGGRIAFDGKDITRRRPQEVARMGLVRTFQKRSFFPDLTVRENILIGIRERATTRDQLLGSAHLAAEAESIMELAGLGARPDEIAESLPYGEQRLLGVGIALTCHPKLMLLDEPCAGMNAVEVDRMIHLIEELRERGHSIIVVEHQMRFVMGISNRVMVLDHGQKLTEGTPKEVRENPQVIEAYLGKGILEHGETA
jgi:branched-chain amino acid transport system ATP-binding protein